MPIRESRYAYLFNTSIGVTMRHTLTWAEEQRVWHQVEQLQAFEERKYLAYIKECEDIERIADECMELEVKRYAAHLEVYYQHHHIPPLPKSRALALAERITELLE